MDWSNNETETESFLTMDQKGQSVSAESKVQVTDEEQK
jgi:hypothetical protein